MKESPCCHALATIQVVVAAYQVNHSTVRFRASMARRGLLRSSAISLDGTAHGFGSMPIARSLPVKHHYAPRAGLLHHVLKWTSPAQIPGRRVHHVAAPRDTAAGALAAKPGSPDPLLLLRRNAAWVPGRAG